jgi:hypothetical protein
MEYNSIKKYHLKVSLLFQGGRGGHFEVCENLSCVFNSYEKRVCEIVSCEFYSHKNHPEYPKLLVRKWHMRTLIVRKCLVRKSLARLPNITSERIRANAILIHWNWFWRIGFVRKWLVRKMIIYSHEWALDFSIRVITTLVTYWICSGFEDSLKVCLNFRINMACQSSR